MDKGDYFGDNNENYVKVAEVLNGNIIYRNVSQIIISFFVYQYQIC